MAAYEFRCPEDGPWEELRPIGTAPDQSPCPVCGRPARRVITAPRLSLASRARVRAIDAAEASADTPAVVTALPRRTAARQRGRQAERVVRGLPRP